MRILHVSYSRAGGIGNVVSDLAEAQVLQGHEVEWDYVTTGPLRSEFLQHPIETVKAGLDDIGLRSRHFLGPISSLRSGHSIMKRAAKKLDRFDVVHLHGGTLDLAVIAQVETSARVVLSHHDMRLVTGACHQSMGCVGFQTNCSDCPALRSPFRHRAQQQRADSFPFDWRHTAPSPKFASVLGESLLLSASDVAIVPNPLPAELVEFQSSGKNDELLTIVSSSSASPLRNLAPEVLERLVRLAEENDLKLVSIGGNVYDPRYVKNLGSLSRRETFDIMSRSSICFTPTKFESFSTSGLEALYSGAHLMASLESPQGELAESLQLRIDLDTPILALESNRLKDDVQQTLLETFGIQRVIEKLQDVYFH